MKKLMILLLVTLMAFGASSCAGNNGTDPSEATPAPTEADSAPAETTQAPADTQPVLTPEPATDAPSDTPEPTAEAVAKEFTRLVTLEDLRVEFCVPDDFDGGMFTDMGVSCLLTVDCYGNDVVAYHEYDDEGEITKVTIGSYTFDYQKFNHFGIPDWRMYVIRISFGNYAYYRFVYNVYSEEYDDAQVQRFMETIRFLDED